MNVLWPDFAKRGGLLPVVVVDAMSNRVLMLVYTDEAGYRETIATGEVIIFSTSRGKRWKKGEESGNVMKVLDIFIDCDNDALLYAVQPFGPACHTRASTCFFDSCLYGRRVAGLAQQPESDCQRTVVDVEVHVSLTKKRMIY